MIVDMHVHVAPPAVAPKTIALFEERTGTKLIYDFSIGALLEVIGSRIDKACIFDVVLKPEIVPGAGNWVAEQVRQHPDKLVGMYAPHPDYPDMAGELERCVKELGFKGIKLNGSLHRYFSDDKRLVPLFDKANELGVPVLVHTGRNVENFRVKEFDRSVRQYSEPKSWIPILKSYPRLPFVLAHLAGAVDFWDDALQLVADHPNAYVDLAHVVALSTEKQVEFVKAIGVDRVMFGSDYPGYNANVEMDKIRSLNIEEGAKRAILGDNAARVFKLA